MTFFLMKKEMCYEINCVLKTNTVESLETLKCLTVLLKPVQH